jgi:tetratricopeptide (TPR) repeat protein
MRNSERAGSAEQQRHRDRRCPGRFLFAVLVLIAACTALPSAAQQNDGPSQQSQEQVVQAAAQYEKLLANPPAGTQPSALTAVRVRLGTADFLLHRYPDSLRALAPILVSDARKSSAAGSESALLMAQAWLICGLDHLELNEAQDAIAPLRRALVLDPENANARLALGDAFARTHAMEKAEKQYEEQLHLTPSLPDTWYKLGMVHIELAGDSKKQLATLSDAHILSQQLNAEGMLAGEANWDAARLLLNLAKAAPKQPGVHADLGRALLALGYAKSAEEEFRKELAFDPEDPTAMLGLAETEALNQQWAEADKEVDQLARSQPQQFARLVESAPPGPLRQAWNDGATRIPDSAAGAAEGIFWKTWLTASSLSPDVIASIASPASCTTVSGADETATGRWLSESCYRRLIQQLQARQQLSSAASIKLVETMFRLGDFQEALQQATRILQSHPRDPWAMYWLSRAHSELAGDCFVKLALLNPSSSRVHQMLAERYLGWGQFTQAVAEYQTAIRLEPGLPDLYLGLGDTYTHMLDWTDAATQYRKTLELAPGSLAARAQLGHAYVKLGQWKPAIDELNQIPVDAPQADAARLDLAIAEDQAGETRQAIADLLPFLDKDKDGEIHFRLAGFYRKIGDADRARQAMQAFQGLRAAELAVSHGEIEALENEKAKNASVSSSVSN